ncbi:MAG: SAM-dependent chlorinase/fluorinase [Bacteroidales bacterium]|nr:SAM-dependent chlorinase/fluorinase [Bacteroidales bacterium]
MSIITLTSDWGSSDFYIAAVKGAILSKLPDTVIVDISHQIKPFDIEGAAFTVRNSYQSFPKGTVHIVAVNTVETTDHPHIAIQHDGHYFIGTDNGVFSMIVGDTPEAAVQIEVYQDSDLFTFSTRDRFVKVAVQLLTGTPLDQLGILRPQLTSRLLFEPAISQDSIKGMVIHIDGYDNAITNISAELFQQLRRKRPFEIYFAGYRLNSLMSSYLDVEVAELLALFGTHGMLEIAMNQGNAASLCGLEKYTPVNVRFINADETFV